MGLLVNCFGGPGVGKSTVALGVAYGLKLKQIRSEYVPEVAKAMTWEGRHRTLEWQAYVSSKQHRDICRVLNQVDVVVTDSPFLTGCFYKPKNYGQSYDEFMIERHQEMDTLDYLIERVVPYDEVGRNQTEEQARGIDWYISQWLSIYEIPCIRLPGVVGSVEVVLRDIEQRLAQA